MADRIDSADFAALAQLRKVRVKYELGKSAALISVGEQLLTVLASPLAKTMTSLLDQVAALTVMADGNRSIQTDQERVSGTDEDHIPSFKPAWADRRLSQTDVFLYREAAALETWLNRPHDPNRTDLCPKCSNPARQGDQYCSHCGTRVGEADERSKMRVRCLKSRCSRSKKPIPKYIKHGRSWIEFLVCSGTINGELCGARLKDMS